MSKLQQNLLNYIKQNPVKFITSLSFIIGGLFLLIYFWHVEYFPTNIKFDDIFLVSLLSCTVGILFIAIVILTLTFPVISYQSCRKLSQFEKVITYKYLRHYKTKPKVQSFIGSIFDGCIRPLQIQKRYNPQFFLLLIPLFTFVVLSVSLIYLVHYKIINGSIGFLILILLTFIEIVFIFQKNFKIIFPNIEFKFIFKSKILYIYLRKILSSIVFISFSFIISFPIMTNSPELKNENSLFIYTIIFMMLFIFINIIEREFFKRIVINILILFTFLFITKTLHVIPSIILKEFNIAQVKVDKISIDAKGCKIINPDSNGSQCIEKNIRLVWKFGSMYVFDKPLDSNFTTFERYEIPQEFILSRQQILKISN